MRAAEAAGRVAALHRYPVKSLLGESLDELAVEVRGCAGDRLWSVRDPDGKFGSGKSTRRFRRMDGLLALTAAYDGHVPVVTFPDGRVLHGSDPAIDAALSDHVGRPVRLGREADVSHFDEGPVHLVTTASLDTLSRAHGRPVDHRHTRANVLVAHDGPGFPEHGWVGRRVRLGDEVLLEVTAVMPRCVMVGLAQGDVPADGGLLRSVNDVTAGALGAVADVVRPGLLRIGDPVSVEAAH